MRLGTVAVLAILAVVPVTGRAADPEPVRDELVAAVPRDFPPYYGTDNTGRPNGHSIEVMDELAKRANIGVRYRVHADWDAAMESLRRGEADLIPNLGITPERLVDFDFTVPLETFSLGIFVRSDDRRVNGVDDLGGIKTGVVKGNAAVAWIRNYPQVKAQEVDSQEQALFALLSGEIDAFIYPVTVTWRMASAVGVEGRIRQAGLPLVEIKRAVAVRKGNTGLLQRLDDAVREYTRSSEFRAAYARLHSAPKPFWTGERMVRYAMGAITLILGLSVVTMAWWYRLRVASLNRQLAECRALLKQPSRVKSSGEGPG